MTKEVKTILMKENYTIQDIAKIVNKTTATVRSWEEKNITPRLKRHSDNGWKNYTRRDLEELLTCLVNFQWERNVIKNMDDLNFIIKYCRGIVTLDDYPKDKLIDETDITKETEIYNEDIQTIII